MEADFSWIAYIIFIGEYDIKGYWCRLLEFLCASWYDK